MLKIPVEGSPTRTVLTNLKHLCSLASLSILASCNHQTTPLVDQPKLSPVIETQYLQQDQYIDIPQANLASSVPVQPSNVWDVLSRSEGLGDESQKLVQQQLRLLTNNQHHFDILSHRASAYFHPIIKELQKRQMPLFLALVPMIESGYQPDANSSWNAAGLWQIIPSTGKHLKLKQNWWYDGRLDAMASTHAALTYLQELHQRFDDWPLALAAYNSGGATVSNAMKKNRKAKRAQDYWSLKLPPETRVYVPKLIALDLIIKNPAKYGIKLEAIPLTAHLKTVNTHGQLSLKKAAELANIDLATLRELNPALKRWATAPDGPNRLILPIEAAPSFEFGLARLAKEDYQRWQPYTIKKGDTLSQLAQNFVIPISQLRKINQLKGNKIRIGQQLLIPAEAAPELRLASRKNWTKLKKNKYKIKSGDSLWQIARSFDLHVTQILKWNNITRETPLKPGQELTILLEQ